MKIIEHGNHIMFDDDTPFLMVGFPSAYKLVKAGLPVLGRVSEFEPVCMLFKHQLIDPITSWSAARYEKLIKTTELNHELYVMMPSVHGHSLIADQAVADVCVKFTRIKGLVTKFPNELEAYISNRGS